MTSEKCKDLAMFDTESYGPTIFCIFWAETCLTIHFQTAALKTIIAPPRLEPQPRRSKIMGFSQKIPAMLGGNIGIPTKVPSDFSYAPEV